MGRVEIGSFHQVSSGGLLQTAAHRTQGFRVAKQPGLRVGQMHRFDGFQDQLAALLHQPKTNASPGFTQVDPPSLIGRDHLLIAGHWDTPNWEIQLSLVWLHPDPFASTAALTGYEHWLARGDRI
jgi:hypothetical protein